MPTLDEAQAALDAAKANCAEGEDDAAHAAHAAELATAYDEFQQACYDAAEIVRPTIRTTVLNGVRQEVTS